MNRPALNMGPPLLYIAVGCMNIPFLFECRRLKLCSKLVFGTSSASMECGNITNKGVSLFGRIAIYNSKVFIACL